MYWIFLFFFVTLLPQARTDWVRFAEREGLFTVLAPAEMRYREKLIETSTGDYLLQTVFLGTELDSCENYLFLINYHQVEEGLFAMDSMQLNEQLLQWMAEDIASDSGGDLLYVNPVHSDTWATLEYKVSFNEDELNLKGKLVLTPTHLFSLQAYSTRQYALNTQRDHFLDSFRITQP